MTASPRRTAWIDIARGIGIILVVYAHAARGLVLGNDLPGKGWPIMADTFIYAFHMPLFFVLAGLHIERSVARGRRAFIISKLQTIAWPYFLWSLIQGGIKLAVAPYTNRPIAISDLVGIPVVPIEQFWFLYVLFLCQLLIGLVLPRRWLLLGLTLAGVLAWATIADASIFFRTLHYLPYVVIGLFALPALTWLGARSAAQWSILALAWIAFLFLVQPLDAPAKDAPIMYGLALLGSVGTIAGAMILGASSLPTAWLQTLGQLSLPIFLMHTIFSAAVRVALKMVGLDDPVFMLSVGTAAGIILSLLAYRLAGAMGLTRILGFGPPVAH